MRKLLWVKTVYKMEVNTVNCLFCALPCSPDFVINKTKPVKTEQMFSNGEDVTSFTIAFGGEDELIEEHLKAVFILRKILKIPQEVLCQFLGKGNGQFHPELWFNVCQSCGESVTQFYSMLKQISKLETKLTSIQTELKGRITESKGVDNKDFVWGKIREEALKDYSPHIVGEEYNISAVKTENEPETRNPSECIWDHLDQDDNREEIQNHSHDQEDEDDTTFINNEETFDNDQRNAQSFQPFAHQSSSSLHNIPDDDDDDDEEEEIQFVTDFNPLDFQLPQVPRTKRYFYACHQCSFQSNTKTDFEAHQRLHEEGSGALICDECERPVLPEKMERHRAMHSSMGYNRRRRSTLTVEEINNSSISNSNPRPGKYHYKCSHCPFESNSRVRLGIHLKLHEEGSGAASCSECGYYVDPKKFARHRALRHTRVMCKYKTCRNWAKK